MTGIITENVNVLKDFILSEKKRNFTYHPHTNALIFIGETLLCLNWAIVADILLYVVIPTRRSTAEAFQILTSHALGDAGSPYLIGQVADWLSGNFKGDPQSPQVQFYTLQLALYITPFICVVGGAFFLATALFIVDDKEKANKLTQGIVDVVKSYPERGIDGIPILFRVEEDDDPLETLEAIS